MRFTMIARLMITTALAGLLTVAGACSQEGAQPDATPQTVAAPAGPPSRFELRVATFQGVHTQAVTLKDGRWEGEPYTPGAASLPVVVLMDDLEIRGDLNGDGADEAVVLLSTTTGGSGESIHVAVVAREGHEIVNTATAELGDRVQLRSGAVEGGKIVLHVVQHGAADPACCPGDLAIRTWVLTDGNLIETSTEITGRLSLGTLAGKAWLLERLASDEAAPEYPQITLFFEGNRAVGSGGCNRYFGRARTGNVPGSLTVGPFGGTKKACPDLMMELEHRYMMQLENASGFSFLGGKLAVTWKNGGKTGVMLFEGHELAEEG